VKIYSTRFTPFSLKIILCTSVINNNFDDYVVKKRYIVTRDPFTSDPVLSHVIGEAAT